MERLGKRLTKIKAAETRLKNYKAAVLFEITAELCKAEEVSYRVCTFLEQEHMPNWVLNFICTVHKKEDKMVNANPNQS